METILLVILIILALALIAVVLVQRSEGGALGIGGGQGGLFSARGSGNLLTRITAGLAAAFMILSLVLVILEGGDRRSRSVMDAVAPAEESDVLPADAGDLPATPESDGTAAAPSPTAPESGAAVPSDPQPVVPQSE